MCGVPNNEQACHSSVEAITAEVANLTQAVQQLVKDCFNVGNTQCTRRINVVVQDFTTIGEDVAQVVEDCGSSGTNPSCVADLEGMSADLVRAIVDITTAVTICTSAATHAPPSLFRQARRSLARIQ